MPKNQYCPAQQLRTQQQPPSPLTIKPDPSPPANPIQSTRTPTYPRLRKYERDSQDLLDEQYEQKKQDRQDRQDMQDEQEEPRFTFEQWEEADKWEQARFERVFWEEASDIIKKEESLGQPLLPGLEKFIHVLFMVCMEGSVKHAWCSRDLCSIRRHSTFPASILQAEDKVLQKWIRGTINLSCGAEGLLRYEFVRDPAWKPLSALS